MTLVDGVANAQRLWRSPSGQPETPVWLDCDTGHDDAFALLVSAVLPRLNLLGISTVCGNAPLSHTTTNTLSILEAIGSTDLDVFPGAAKPLCRHPCFAPDIHGESGLDGTTCLPVPTTAPNSAIPAIEVAYKALKATLPQTAYIVATGSLTNMALLFAVHPDLATHIKGLNIMGGALGSNFTPAPMGTVSTSTSPDEHERFGNITPFAEFNIYNDPESARAIFSNPILAAKIFLAPLDLSHLFLATPDVQNALLYGPHDPADPPATVRILFHEILTFFGQTYADVFGLTEGPPLHDVLPCLAVFAPELFDDRGGERFSVEVVVTDGPDKATSRLGQTIARRLPSGEDGVCIPRGLDQASAWGLIELSLQQAELITEHGLVRKERD